MLAVRFAGTAASSSIEQMLCAYTKFGIKCGVPSALLHWVQGDVFRAELAHGADVCADAARLPN